MYLDSLESRQLFATDAVFFVDTVYVYATPQADVIEIFNDGNSLVVNSDSASSFYFNPADVDRVIVWAYEGNDSVTVEPSVSAAASLYGEAGNDTLTGGSGNDLLLGGLGGDVLNGGAGNDTLRGESANDTLKADAGADILDGGAAIDLADYGSRNVSQNVSLDNVANDGSVGEGDNVRDTVENIKGGYGDDVLTGSAVTNHIWGSYGKDRIFGLGGDDYLFGGYHQDSLYGGAGIDFLDGGNDGVVDHLWGQAGGDTFIQNTIDLAVDFAAAQGDVIV